MLQVADLLEQLEQFKENLMKKNEEILQLKSKLEVGKNANINKLIQLKEENAHLKVCLQFNFREKSFLRDCVPYKLHIITLIKEKAYNVFVEEFATAMPQNIN